MCVVSMQPQQVLQAWLAGQLQAWLAGQQKRAAWAGCMPAEAADAVAEHCHLLSALREGNLTSILKYRICQQHTALASKLCCIHCLRPQMH